MERLIVWLLMNREPTITGLVLSLLGGNSHSYDPRHRLGSWSETKASPHMRRVW